MHPLFCFCNGAFRGQWICYRGSLLPWCLASCGANTDTFSLRGRPLESSMGMVPLLGADPHADFSRLRATASLSDRRASTSFRVGGSRVGSGLSYPFRVAPRPGPAARPGFCPAARSRFSVSLDPPDLARVFLAARMCTGPVGGVRKSSSHAAPCSCPRSLDGSPGPVPPLLPRLRA